VARTLPPTGDLPPDQIKLVAEDFERFLQATGLSLDKVSKSLGSGYSASVLSTFKSIGPDGRTKYTGNVDKVARAVNGYMERYAQQQEAYRPEGFVRTEAAVRMLTVVQQAQRLRAMGLITSDPGRGKTMVLKAAQAIYHGAIYIRVRRKRRTDAGLIRALHDEMRLRAKGTGYDMEQKIIETLGGTDRMLLIDEAHQLTKSALEFIRDINDECEIPIVLAGTRDLEQNTQDQGVFFGQFASRVALRYDVNDSARSGKGGAPSDPTINKPIHTVKEILELFQGSKLRLTDDGRDFLFQLANLEGRGGLRLVRQVLSIAIPYANGKQLSRKVLMKVVRDMHGKRRADVQLAREIEQLKVKAA
jgi:DNA transposition AAA+ family ATPase